VPLFFQFQNSLAKVFLLRFMGLRERSRLNIHSSSMNYSLHSSALCLLAP